MCVNVIEDRKATLLKETGWGKRVLEKEELGKKSLGTVRTAGKFKKGWELGGHGPALHLHKNLL